ncbi:hypothetical protein [Pseudomonas putida]|uniref:hypothetical protein n=1 Tax=Pseudomonas putida TaxID=303 RepID=UPI0020C48251|nr:hypothetical protein [Pseudomonas putida]UTL83503.1 hypothetical protein NL778_12055 [Pseudomonas putida]
MKPLQSWLARRIGFTSISIATVGALFTLYVALDSDGYAPILGGSSSVMWALTFLWLTNVITLVLNAVVWLFGRRPRWLCWTLGGQMLFTIGLLFVEG